MKNISLDITKAACFLEAGAVKAFEPKVKKVQIALEEGTCPGNDFLGWLHLPSSITPEFIAEVNQAAQVLREKCEAVVVAGIGGSYLGARAVIEALSNSFAWLVNDKKNPTILFAGNNIGEDYLSELTEYLKGKKFGVINISKSGTTTETALTFRLLKKQCERHTRQRWRTLLRSHSGWSAANSCCRLRHQSTRRGRSGYGEGVRQGRSFRGEYGCTVCCRS